MENKLFCMGHINIAVGSLSLYFACGGGARAPSYQAPVTLRFREDFLSDVAFSQSERRTDTFAGRSELRLDCAECLPRLSSLTVRIFSQREQVRAKETYVALARISI